MSVARKEQDERDTREDPPSLHAGRYEIRLKGHLDARWAAWFDGLRLTHEADGTTRLHGPVSTRLHCTACSRRSATSACR